MGMNGQYEALKKPICQHYQLFLSRICRPEVSGQKPKCFDGFPSPRAVAGFVFASLAFYHK
jgi:hypothetical protein